MQFLVQWYQLLEMQFIVQLAVSRRAVSSTVVSADMQFLVVVSNRITVSSTVVLADKQFLAEWYQLSEMQFIVQLAVS